MKYQNVYLNMIEYALPPHVLTSVHIEEQLTEVYEKLHIQPGQLTAWTGIHERRLWAPNTLVSDGAIQAGKKIFASSDFSPAQIDMLIYAGVCRDQREPATACRIAHALEVGPTCQIFDLSNACLGVLNAILQGANAISAGQAKTVLIVAAESSREIIESTLKRIQQNPTMEFFKQNIATLTGGSGAAALLLTHEEISAQGHKLLGGVTRQASQYYELCRWGRDRNNSQNPDFIMETDAVGVLKNGVDLGVQTFHDFQNTMNWGSDAPDKIITHQVGAAHQATFLKAISLSSEKDFTTFPVLGNIGSVSLPITAAIANQREILQKNHRVGFLGIGSGLNCLMLGFQW